MRIFIFMTMAVEGSLYKAFAGVVNKRAVTMISTRLDFIPLSCFFSSFFS